MTFGLASFLSAFIPSVGGLIAFNKVDVIFKNFTLLLMVICMLECIANYQFYHHQSNLFVYNICLILETTVLPLIVLKSIKWKLMKLSTVIAIVTFLLTFFFKLFYFKSIQTIGTEYRIYSCIILILLSGTIIIQQSKITSIHLLLNPLFILSFSLLFYYGVSLFAQGACHLIANTKYQQISQQIWKAHSIVNIFTNLSFTFSIWLSYRQKKLSL